MKVQENKKVIAQSEITISISKDDKVSGTIQHELVDESTETTLNEGEETALTLTDDQQAQIVAALAPILSAAINSTTPEGTSTEVVAAG